MQLHASNCLDVDKARSESQLHLCRLVEDFKTIYRTVHMGRGNV